MAPSELLFFPSSLTAERLCLGSLLSDPFTATTPSFFPSNAHTFQNSVDSSVQSPYKDTIVCAGRKLEAEAEAAFNVEADEMTYRRLLQSAHAFESMCTDSKTRTFLKMSALSGQPLYFVTGLQELRNAVVTPVKTQNTSIETSSETFKLPVHVRRDSAMDTTAEAEPNKAFGVEIREVRAKIERPDEPHTLQDIGFRWSHFPLDEHSQLSIGLGDIMNFQEPAKRSFGEDDTDWSENFGYIIELED